MHHGEARICESIVGMQKATADAWTTWQKELVRLNVELIVAVLATPTVAAKLRRASTIPIVMIGVELAR